MTVEQRSFAAGLDASDPLKDFRDGFSVPDSELIYMDGNSLGRLPLGVAERIQSVIVEGWGNGLIRSWTDWIDWGARIGDQLAAHVLGANPGEVVISDSTTVNMYKLATAALDSLPGRTKVLVASDEFPTNLYVLQGLAAHRELQLVTLDTDPSDGLDVDVLSAALDTDVALVVLSLVSYRTGALLDMAKVNELAHQSGALVLWDLSHAAGVVPIELAEAGADLAVGCTYKYLNGGPGSPAFLYVRGGLQSAIQQPIWGWFGQTDKFRMGSVYEPAAGIERFLVSTPPVLSLATLEPALDLVARATVQRIRDKGLLLATLADELTQRWLVPLGFTVVSPKSLQTRGSHVSLHHDDAWQICQELAANANVICDYRDPGCLRVGPSPLYTRFVDVWDTFVRIRNVVEGGSYKSQPRIMAEIT